MQVTTEYLGVSPEATGVRIDSSLVRPSAVHFTLTTRMCDCDSLIGRRGDEVPGEIGAAAWLSWLRELPDRIDNLSRIAVLKAWSPEGAAQPSHATSVTISDIGEEALRSLEDDALLVIDYPR
ncbi:MAG: hypothetical protein QM650_11125 [Microlunatus sp.]